MRATSPQIRNCYFKFKCTKDWADLENINAQESTSRKCVDCSRIVYLVEDQEELADKIYSNQCIAISVSLSRKIFEARLVKSIEKPLVGHIRFNDL